MNNKLQLVIPDVDHEEMYTKMMDLWEDLDEEIQPQLLSRYSSKKKRMYHMPNGWNGVKMTERQVQICLQKYHVHYIS